LSIEPSERPIAKRTGDILYTANATTSRDIVEGFGPDFLTAISELEEEVVGEVLAVVVDEVEEEEDGVVLEDMGGGPNDLISSLFLRE